MLATTGDTNWIRRRTSGNWPNPQGIKLPAASNSSQYTKRKASVVKIVHKMTTDSFIRNFR
jgi:hypothetical protein